MSEPAVMDPVHPGEVLLEEYLEPLGITQHRLAVAIRVPPRRINEIVHGKRGVSADTALRLAKYFGTSERFWLNLQGRYELEVERDRLTGVLEHIEPLTARCRTPRGIPGTGGVH
jgi:addiction module HigA family antidote